MKKLLIALIAALGSSAVFANTTTFHTVQYKLNFKNLSSKPLTVTKDVGNDRCFDMLDPALNEFVLEPNQNKAISFSTKKGICQEINTYKDRQVIVYHVSANTGSVSANTGSPSTSIALFIDRTNYLGAGLNNYNTVASLLLLSEEAIVSLEKASCSLDGSQLTDCKSPSDGLASTIINNAQEIKVNLNLNIK